MSGKKRQYYGKYMHACIYMVKNTAIRLLFLIGSIFIIAGILFIAQSKSLIGPQSSFMYSNPQWSANGFLIIITGLSLLVSGIAIPFFTR